MTLKHRFRKALFAFFPPGTRYFMVFWEGSKNGTRSAGIVSASWKNGFPNRKKLENFLSEDGHKDVRFTGILEISESDFNDWNQE